VLMSTKFSEINAGGEERVKEDEVADVHAKL
jgi:hypothetical protein